MYIKYYNSPIGIICLESDGEYLTRLSLDNYTLNDNYIEKDLDIFNEVIRWLNIYLKGKNPNFTPIYKINNLTSFRNDVFDIVKDIPYGKVITYKDIATAIMNKRGTYKMSCQAIGRAVSLNPIPLIVPCHRVVGSNKKLVGYSLGLENKKVLLELEGINNLR